MVTDSAPSRRAVRAQRNLPQELQGVVDALGSLARDAELHGPAGPHGHEDRVVAGLAELL